MEAKQRHCLEYLIPPCQTAHAELMFLHSWIVHMHKTTSNATNDAHVFKPT